MSGKEKDFKLISCLVFIKCEVLLRFKDKVGGKFYIVFVFLEI